MIVINNVEFSEKPRSCGSCSFFFSGSTSMRVNPGRGHCTMFDEFHQSYIELPKRCKKLFNKAFRFPEGTELVIIIKD